MKHVTILLLTLLAAAASQAQTAGPLVSPPALMATSEPLLLIAQRQAAGLVNLPPLLNAGGPSSKNSPPPTAPAPSNPVSPLQTVTVPANQPYAQMATYQPLGATMGVSFEGLGAGTPGFNILFSPPDATLAVGPDHVLQWVNAQIGIYDKSGNAALPAPGFIKGNLLWQGLPAGSLCRAVNPGRPMVQYDKHARRWVLSQPAHDDTFTQNAICIAVSTGDSPLGAYQLYEYSFGNRWPESPKLGVWTDAYHLTFNTFEVPAPGVIPGFRGGRACAYDRIALLAGLPATQICFDSVASSLLPSDLDGHALPPAGAPNYLVAWDYYRFPRPPYTVRMHRFRPDFANPAASTFDDGLGGAPFSFVGFALDAGTDAPCDGIAYQACVPQLGTTQLLDTMGDRLSFRLSYRNYGSFDALLITHAVDESAGVNSQLRWMEIRNPGSPAPVVHQNSTYRPGSVFRWMSSGAQDKVGNIAIGYSVSSPTMHPAIRVTGRRKTDPKNLLRSEMSVIEGAGSQASNINNVSLSVWGETSTMQVDPADDCTFWYTAQYFGANGSFNWRTRIASFRFPNCR